MNVISKRTLVQFYEKNPTAKIALEVWHADVRKSEWESPDQIKRLYASASFLHDNRVVFNIKGNEYRLVVSVAYRFQAIYVKFIGTHAEYDLIDAETVEMES